MKIYSVTPDTNYKLLFPEDGVYDSVFWEFNAQPLAGKLPLHFSAYFKEKSDKPIPDVAWMGMLTFAFRADVATALLDILEPHGELLPCKVEGEVWYVYNVLSVAKVDVTRSSYEVDDGVNRFGLIKPHFLLEDLREKSIFKIEEDNYSATYSIDDRSTDDSILSSLFCAISAHGYTGLKFNTVFDDGAFS